MGLLHDIVQFILLGSVNISYIYVLPSFPSAFRRVLVEFRISNLRMQRICICQCYFFSGIYVIFGSCSFAAGTLFWGWFSREVVD